MRPDRRILAMLAVFALAATTAGWAQTYINLGPPFVELRPMSAPGLVDAAANAARETLINQFAAGRYEEAIGSASVLLESAQAEFGENDTRTVPALIDLAASQHHAEEYGDAQENYTRAVRLLERSENSRDPRLSRPLHGLGVAQYAAGNYTSAVDSLQRAIFITRVNEGLTSLDQLGMYDALAEANLAIGAYDAAVGRQKARISVLQRTQGADSPESLAAVEQSAQMYRRIDEFFLERDVRRRQLRQLEKSEGYDSMVLVPLLIKLAETYRLGYQPDYIAVGDLERALDIIEKHPNATQSPELQAAALMELGDLYLTFRDSARAARYHKQAYAVLARNDDQAQIKALFSEPMPVFIPRPDASPGVGDTPAAGLPVGYVLAEFNLGSTGRPRDIEVLEINPASASIMRPRVERALRAARFRPARDAGGLKKSTGVRYKLKFNYVPPDR